MHTDRGQGLALYCRCFWTWCGCSNDFFNDESYVQNLVSQYSTPAGVLREMNSTFYNITHGTYYITAFVRLYSGWGFDLFNGGHPYPIIVDSSNDKVYMLENNGFW